MKNNIKDWLKCKNLPKLDIKTILIIILVIIILLLRSCGPGVKPEPVEIIKVGGKKFEVVKRDTIYRTKTVTTTVFKKGEDIYHDTTIYVNVPAVVDTLEILRDYYSKRVFKDTIYLNDSLGYVVILDTISTNRVLSRKFDAKVKEKVNTITVFLKEPPKRQMYFGVGTGVDRRLVFRTLETDLLYKDRKDRVYSIGVGVLNNNNTSTINLTPYIKGSMYFKIKL